MATVTLRQDGLGDYTVLLSAVAGAGLGGTVIIEDSETYTVARGDFNGAAATFVLDPPAGGWDGFTIRAADGESPLFDGTGVSSGKGIGNFNNRDDILIQGIRHENWAGSNTGCYKCAGSDGVRLDNVAFHDCYHILMTPEGNGDGIVLNRLLATGDTRLMKWSGIPRNVRMVNYIWDMRGEALDGPIFYSASGTGMTSDHGLVLLDDPGAKDGILARTIRNSVVVYVDNAPGGKGIEGTDGYNNLTLGFSTPYTLSGVDSGNIDGDALGYALDDLFRDYASDDFTPVAPYLSGGIAGALFDAALDIGETEDYYGTSRPLGLGFDIGPIELPAFMALFSGVVGRGTFLTLFTNYPDDICLELDRWSVSPAVGDDFVVVSVERDERETNGLLVRVAGSFTFDHGDITVAPARLADSNGNPLITSPWTINGQVNETRDTFIKASSAGPLKDFRRASPSLDSKITVNGEGDYEFSIGVETLERQIIRRIVTLKGGFWHLPEYGLGLKPKKLIRPSSLPGIRRQIKDTVLGITGVEDANVTVRSDKRNILWVDVSVRTGNKTHKFNDIKVLPE